MPHFTGAVTRPGGPCGNALYRSLRGSGVLSQPGIRTRHILVNLKALPLLKLQQLPPEEPRLRIKADGSLQIGRKDGQIDFAFNYLGFAFEANTRPTATGTVVQVAAEVAPLPYSAEGVAARRAVIAIIEASQALPEARLVVSKSRWIYCIGKAALPDDWEPHDVISATTRLVLEVKPYLVMLQEALPYRARLPH
jgi:hypothetical protein